jgi:hypothetical protein
MLFSKDFANTGPKFEADLYSLGRSVWVLNSSRCVLFNNVKLRSSLTKQQFVRVFPNQDEVVEVNEGLPTPEPETWDYILTKPEEVHMLIAARQVTTGLANPKCSNNMRQTLNMIPKKSDGPLDPKHGACGWGMRAVQGYSLKKILCYFIFVLVLGLVFVVLWLVFVSKTDLQNAIIVPTWLFAVFMCSVAIPPLLGTA